MRTRTKFPTAKPKVNKRTKFPKPKHRTKFPIPKHKKKVDRFKNGPVIRLSPPLCKALERVYTPPLSYKEIMEKRTVDAIRPDMSHMTRWSPR